VKRFKLSPRLGQRLFNRSAETMDDGTVISTSRRLKRKFVLVTITPEIAYVLQHAVIWDAAKVYRNGEQLANL